MANRNREKDIMEAAIKVFSEKGFSGATTSEIAKEAGVAEGTIFRYFRTKKEILDRVLGRLIEIVGDRYIIERLSSLLEVHKEKDEKEILRALLMDRLEILSQHKDMLKVILTEVQFHSDLQEIFIKNIVLKGKTFMEQFFEAGIARGIFREINPTIAVRNLVGMMGMYAIQKQIVPEIIPMSEEEQIEMMIDMFLNGICKNNK